MAIAQPPDDDSDTTLKSITESDLPGVKQIHSILFPIKYSPQFYDEIQKEVNEPFCKLAYVRGVLAGTICCRIEPYEDGNKLYLMTMGVLAIYRDRGVGTKALRHVLDAARDSQEPLISSIYLHVQISNEGAKRFYHRHGFVEVGLAEGYYKKIQPRDAWVLECKLHSDPPELDTGADESSQALALQVMTHSGPSEPEISPHE